MLRKVENHIVFKLLRVATPIALLLLLAFPASLRAQKSEEFDNYKLRIDTLWFYSNPSGSITGKGETVPIDFQKDLGFNSYSTFSGKVDWKFTHKNHFYVAFAPFYSSRTTTLTRDITFQGQTFTAGLVVKSELHPWVIAPGYQYDIIRRRRGHLGIGVQIDLFNTSAKISAAAQINGEGVQQAAITAKGSLLAPIPVAGPEFRLYLTNSPRLFVQGNLYGMYFFGYGNFVSTTDVIGITLTKHISATAGYQLGSRLNVTGTQNRLALDLTQKGAVAGLEFHF
jgi:hypothetical protein